MLDYLIGLDQTFILWVNGMHTPFLDKLMWFISSKAGWIPLYVLLLYIVFKYYGFKKGCLLVAFLILSIGVTDFICSSVFKPYFQRLRPSHEPALNGLLHFHQYEDGSLYKGGMYGFISSHAGNFLAIVTFLSLTLRKHVKGITLVLGIIAFLVCYSRMYLGVHYFSDILVGGLVGFFISFLTYRIVYQRFLEN